LESPLICCTATWNRIFAAKPVSISSISRTGGIGAMSVRMKAEPVRGT